MVNNVNILNCDKNVTNESIVETEACRKVNLEILVLKSAHMEYKDEQMWLSIPEVAQLLGVPLRDVRTMIGQRQLLAVRRGPNNALAIAKDELVEVQGAWQPIKALRGTLMLLADAQLTDDEAMQWLMEYNDELETHPLDALRKGNIHAVRRAVVTL